MTKIHFMSFSPICQRDDTPIGLGIWSLCGIYYSFHTHIARTWRNTRNAQNSKQQFNENSVLRLEIGKNRNRN